MVLGNSIYSSAQAPRVIDSIQYLVIEVLDFLFLGGYVESYVYQYLSFWCNAK